jgi:O-antigen/teichoic acid export membrane protein
VPVRLRWQESRRLLARGIPSLGVSVGTTVAFRVDRYLLGVLADPTAVGIYSVAVTASEILRIPANAYGQVSLYRAASGTTTLAQIWRSERRLIVLALLPATLLMIFGQYAIDLVFGPSFAAAATPLRLLLVAEMVLLTYPVNVRVLLGLGATKTAGTTGLIGAAVTVALDVALIPAFGASGAAVASIIGYATMSLSAVLQVKRAWRSQGQVARTAPDAW